MSHPNPSSRRSFIKGTAAAGALASIGQPVFATMVMLALVVLGAFSYLRLPVEQMPDVDSPMVSVMLGYPGASPEAIENDLLKPIENAINTVNGIGGARNGQGVIRFEF